jgi:NAD(P)-dependent dehydrogenase (short-subunit alcohol dehydrogenase family)
VPGIQIAGRVALVTGANRGIGRAIVEALLARGARTVYAAARKPEALAEVVAVEKDELCRFGSISRMRPRCGTQSHRPTRSIC